ncbi:MULTISPECIES: magnesium/cobalt transporter CorA [Methanoculleus]|uniref:Magnesium transport protein CorA n=2 Tax=Methanoculleus TaxID=45989 RepID=A3CTM0_METMJ|nr:MULTISPECIES: magnesium/cobalt transporter CorA [Methanoculleus]ABN56720.1 magnesium and cobalt transport protein CorA [Methanoculleus marisnigri JR1]UYU18153.1 magnesium/cobalt transporter CorA [Methanoculleus submarinus]
MSLHDDQVTGGAAPRSRPVTVTVIDYDESRLEERTYTLPGEFRLSVLHEGVIWIDVDGVHDTGVIQAVGDAVGIHPLTLEDIANTRQRPKIEDYGDYLYVAVRMLAPGDGEFHSEQVSLVLGRGYVVSFQEHPGDVFERIRERLRAGAGRLRSVGPDYLFYALLDAIVDGYFSVIEVFGERIEAVEEEVVADPDRGTLQVIYALKRSLIALRRSVWPLREAVAQLERGESPLIGEQTLVYFRDVYDHTIEVAETVETYRDTMSGILDVYLSSQSSRMNEIMKVLTVIATIFIPLTFIAGVYGMNFAYMPEISHPWGYPAALASMAVVAVAMLLYFRKKGWI